VHIGIEDFLVENRQVSLPNLQAPGKIISRAASTLAARVTLTPPGCIFEASTKFDPAAVSPRTLQHRLPLVTSNTL
jgi:hypothetical protein